MKPQATSDDVIHIGMRSLELYTEALGMFNLREVSYTATTHSPPYQFKYAALPDDLEDGPGPGLFSPMFDPIVTRRLYMEGAAAARRVAWKVGLPALEDE